MTTQYILGESGLWLPEIFLGNAAQGPAASTVVTVDATGEYLHITGRVQWSDRGSHTIDTTGGSAIGLAGSGADLILDNTDILTGQACNQSSFSITAGGA